MLTASLLPDRKSKKKRDRSPSSSSSSSSPSPYPPPFRGKEYVGEGMEHPEENYGHPRYPPRDYGGPGERGPRDYEGHMAERGRGRGFVSSSSWCWWWWCKCLFEYSEGNVCLSGSQEILTGLFQPFYCLSCRESRTNPHFSGFSSPGSEEEAGTEGITLATAMETLPI